MSERLSILNEDYKVLPGSQSLHKLIKWSRDTCALDFLDDNGERRTFSYHALRKCVLYTVPSLQKARLTQDHGTRRLQRIIPVLVPQSPGLYIAILAILEAGAAFCPINLDAPPERIKFVIEDVSAEVVVTTRKYENLVRWQGGPRVILIDDVPAIPEANEDLESNLSPPTPPHDLAYVMYTSGSSGVPKGVAVSHLAVSQSLLAHDRHIPYFSRFLQFASPSFDVSVFEIFFPLFRGSTLVSCRRPQMLNDLTGVITKLEVDAVELTPTVVSSLIQHRSNVPSLTLLMTIGEMLTRPVVESFANSETQDGILYAMYGPTEVAIHCTINPHMEAGTNVADIGVPFDTVSAFIVAADDNSNKNTEVSILPIGEVGELVLGGPQLANEYLNSQEQNETAFINICGQRVYRTGDKARITVQGRIEMLGRISSGQVKIRGQRVELGEIEDAIYRHPHIKTASISVLHGVLIAFVLTRDINLTADDVLKACSTWLPPFMVPSEIVILSAFPYLPSGKVDKKKLESDFDCRRTDESEEAGQWRSPAEQMIGKIIYDIRGINVSRNTRLAACGIDSLVAIRMGSLLRSAGYFLSSIDILKADDMLSLAHICELSRDSQNSVALPTVHVEAFLDVSTVELAFSKANIEPKEIEYTIPCTPVQDAMLSETAIDGIAYKNQIVLDIQLQINTEQIIEAFQALAQMNAILRTGFIEVPNKRSTYLQVIWKAIPSSQFKMVKNSPHGIDNLQNLSILHPLQVQISHGENHTRLFLHIHHAIYDAWSLELILDDLEALLCGKQLQIRPAYERVVAEHFGISSPETTWSSMTYWKDHLSQFNFVPMPSFHSVTNIKRELNVATHSTSIITRDLESAARNLGVSPQSLFQAAFALILSSYLGTKDVCFGTVFSGRTSSIARIEDIVGPCLATLPIRADLSTASTMADLVRQLNLRNRKHLEHDSLPLREIKKASGIDPGQHVFDSLLIWQQTLHDYDHKRNHVQLVDSIDYLEFDLTLEVAPSSEEISIKANYQQSLFPSLQIDILLRQIDQLVATIIQTPDTLLHRADAFLSEELLSIERVIPMISLQPGSLTTPVESMAIDYPDKVAIEFANSISDRLDVTQVTYGELNSKANQIAQYLLSQKALVDDLVCVCLEKSVELYISILAICKAGAGYVPVTPDTPVERLRTIISGSNVKVILTHSSLGTYLEPLKSCHLVFIDRLDLSIQSPENPGFKFEPDSLAYCVFTSGSTGTPKGVLVTQGNLLSNLQALAELYPHTHQSKLLQSCSQAFDVSVFEIFFAWHIGACLCSAVKDVLFRDIELAIRALDITHLSLTPTVAALINPENVPKVEFLVTAGEAVTNKVFNAWADRGLYQGYGPSETTNICTVRPNVTKNHAINNIGPPLKNTSVFVLSTGEDFSPLPRGGEGEFCFGGAQVGRGYLDPNQSVGKFIDYPEYGRLYRSGDYGRILPDGSLSFSGRKDDQVKIRGQRIELGEINSVLLRSSDVIDCISLVIEGDSETDQRLVCFWTPNGSSTREFAGLTPEFSITQELFVALVEALPMYMIPSVLVPVTCLPSTAQGKVDRRQLTSHYKSLSLAYLNQVSRTQKASSEQNWTQLEKNIANTVAKITKVTVSDIGPDTSFFSLGIDSVSAISLSRALRDEMNVRAEISDILRYPSTSRLANRLSQSNNVAKDDASSKSYDFGFDFAFLAATKKRFEDAGRPVERILPCTPLQEAMLSAAETASDDAYNNRLIFEIKVGKERFQQVWAEMIRRHEILRTCFVRTSHSRFAYAQVVLSSFKPHWEIISCLEKDSTQHVQIPDHSRTKYDPPYALRFLRSPHGLRLILSMHHAIYDGYAVSILFEEIEMVLKKLPLPSEVSLVPFLEYMSSVDLVEADGFWGKLLDDFYPSNFPPSGNVIEDRNSQQAQSSVTRLQSGYNLSWIDAQVKKHETSFLYVIQAVWASLLSSQLNEGDICFGNVVSGRTVPVKNVDRLVAPCFNTIPVRIKDLDKLSFLEAFRVLQSQSIDGIPFQLTPLRRIQSRSAGRGVRLFDTLLILQQPARPLNPSIWSIIEDSGAMDMPVVIEIAPQPATDAMELTLHTDHRCVSDSQAADLLKSFDATLRMALRNPRHPMLSPTTVAALNRNLRNSAADLDNPLDVDYGSENSKPLNILEVTILDAVAKFTDIPKVKIKRHTTIYRLGLDSISAVQVAAELRKQGHNVMGSDVLQHPSIEQLATHITSTRQSIQVKEVTYNFHEFDQRYRANICTRLQRPSKHIEAIRPCTPIQCGMLAQTLHTNGQEYINSLSLELVPGSSLERLRSAWESCMRRHEMLRTGFVEIEDAKCPFAMVTYSEDVLSLPWTEYLSCVSHEEYPNSDPKIVLDSISRCPWTLEAFIRGSATVIRFTAHHAIYDAHSLNMILSDVARLYTVGGTPLDMEQVSINPVLGAILNSNDCDEAARKKFWQEENKICINRFPDLTPLRQSTTKISAQERTSSLSMSQVEKLCRRLEVSIQAACQAAWARLLSSYVGESSVTFGLTLSGRGIIEDSEKYAFPTIVTLPVSCEIVGTNSELLSRTMRSNSQLHKNQFTPLTSIQKWVGHSEGKLFDTLFAYQKINGSREAVEPPWKVVREEASTDYTVSMEIQPMDSGSVLFRLTFKENVVPVEQAKLILDQYDALLLDTLQNAQGPSATTPHLNVDILSINPALKPTLPSPIQLLHEFVELQTRLIPQKIALEFTTSQDAGYLRTSSWTFEELDLEGDKIANLLLSCGAKNNDLIAICFNKCPEASFAILGILKAGCAYVALDPNAPPDRLKFIIGDSKSNLVLSIGETAQTLSGIFAGSTGASEDVTVLDLGESRLLNGLKVTKPALARPIDPHDTCYCLYTSGTTGTPKGCEITHENAVQAMMSFQKLFEGHWTEDSKWLQFASFHFDVSVLEQFWSWSVGICVASAPRDLVFEDIPGMIRKLGITHIDLTPSLARLLHPDDVPSLTKGVFITGGEQLRQEILDAWGDYGCIYNGYGPTEATIGVTMYPRVPRNGKPSNIGPQFLNVGSYVFKLGTTEPVLRGAVGELCVSGKLIGKGYLNRPQLTKERFPYLEEFGERVYRTGDLVRILHDGSFLFLGRADDQVKLRGQRLELSEINEVLKKEVHEIEDVVTLVLKHSKQQKEQLVTFYVPSAAGKPLFSSAGLAGSLRNACTGRLPGYMVPTCFIALDKLPLSANNKADFKELAKIFDDMSISDLQNLDSASYTTKTWTAKEKSVLETLAKCTNAEIATIEKSSNIFELGLDSISVISLARSLQEQGYRNATPSLMMKNTSTDSLVRTLASDGNEHARNTTESLAASQHIAAFAHRHKLPIADELGIDASAIECLAPCTPAQEGMIYRFLSSGEALYFSTFQFALKDSVDEERLHGAWDSAASRLQILRTKFVLTGDGCAQVVLKDWRPDWKTMSMQDTNEEDMQRKLQKHNVEVHAMDKASALANPYKISILHTPKTRLLSLHIFHALYDGTSLPLLLRTIHSEYTHPHHQQPHKPSGPPFHTTLPHGPLSRPATARHFWRAALKTHKYHALPRMRTSPAPHGGNDVSATRTIPAQEAQHLVRLGTDLGVTYQAIVLAAWSAVLACLMQAHVTAPTTRVFDLTQGLILSGRSFSLPSSGTSGSVSAEDVQDTIGPLLNTVPFHVRVMDGMSWDELVRGVHAFCVQVVADGMVHTPLRDVVRWCGGSGGVGEDGLGVAGERDLFDTLFVFQREGRLDGGVEGEGVLWEALPGEAVADYPLAFEAQLNNNGDIALTLVGQKEFLDDVAAVGILAEVEKALHDLKTPERAILSLRSNDSAHVHLIDAEETQARQRPQQALRNDAFEWTLEAQQMKSEIESLSRTSDINEHTSIFSLGIDSIDIIKLVSRLRKRGIHITVSSIIKSQTIAKMVYDISNSEPRATKAMTSMKEYEQKLTKYLRDTGTLPGNALTVLPATPLQEGMVAEMIASDYTRYLNHEVFRVSSHVNMQNLKEAWDSVIIKNDILRTRFVEIDDVDLPMSFAQVVCQSAPSYWHIVNLPGGAKLQEEIESVMQSAVMMAKEGVLLHLHGIRHGEEQHFVLSIAHALYDGWSLQALHQDVWAAYHGQLATRPDPRPTLELIMDTEGPDVERFWKLSLAGLQKSTFPRRQVHDVKTCEVVHRRELLSSHPLDKIQALCRATSISIQTLGQTIWAIVLATRLAKLDVVFGAVLSCRDTEEANELLFPLMNTVAVRSVIHGSVSELLRYMQENSNAIRHYQHFPLRRAQALAGIRDGSLFDTLFIYQGRARKTIAVENRLYESVKSVAEVEFAVCVEMEIVDGRLVWRTACKDEALTGAETEALLDCLDGVLETIIQHTDAPTLSSNFDGVSVCGLGRFVNDDGSKKVKVTKPVSVSPETSWTATEVTIRRVLSQVSKIPKEQIDRSQTIFHLGLDSISAIKVSSMLRREGIRLSVNDIMKQTIIANMAKTIDGRHQTPIRKSFDVEKALAHSMKDIDREDIVQQAGADPRNIEDMLPVTAGQLYMLARWQASGGALFVGTFKYCILGPIRIGRLERAWKMLLKKYSILRTIFVVLGDSNPPVVQIVLKDVESNIKWVSSSAPEDKISLTSPLSLSVEKRADDTILCLRIHHALYDGVSLPLLLRHLQALYASPSTDIDSDSSFRQFVARSCDRQYQSMQRRKEFWKSYLSVPTLLCTRDMLDSDDTKRVEVFEPDNSIKNIALIAQRKGVSVDALLLAAFSKVYRSLLDNRSDTTSREASGSTAGTDVVFGLYLANRAIYDEDLSSLSAPTLNLLPMCISPSGSLAQIAQRIQSDLQKLSSADIAGTSLAEIHDWTGISVNCFVNILKPSDSRNNDADAQRIATATQFQFLESRGDGRRRTAEVVELQDGPLLRSAAEKSARRFYEAYPVSAISAMHAELDIHIHLHANTTHQRSVDIEMRVTDDGASLDIGVFAPWEFMHVEHARGVIEGIRSQLSSAESEIARVKGR